MKVQELKVGTPVIYWKTKKSNGEKFDPVETEITQEPFDYYGTLVCFVKHRSGFVACSHIEVIKK